MDEKINHWRERTFRTEPAQEGDEERPRGEEPQDEIPKFL